MAALGGDYIAELMAAHSADLAGALHRLAAEAKATESHGQAWTMFRRAYEDHAKRLRDARLRTLFAGGAMEAAG